VLALLRLAVVWEVMVWRSLARWVARRPAGAGPGVQTFGYARSVTPLYWLFILVSAVEVPVAHVLLPWRWAQVLSLALGVWGLFWMLGMLAAQHVHPHLVDDRGLRLRSGAHVDVALTWSAVRSVTAHRRDLPSARTVQLGAAPRTAAAVAAATPTAASAATPTAAAVAAATPTAASAASDAPPAGSASVLSLPSSSDTRVDVRLARPTEVRLPKGQAVVTEVRVHVDDPAAFVAAVRSHLAAHTTRP
jgi:hypothetical protein